MASEADKQVSPAYLGYNTFTSFLNGLRESGVPLQIDRSIMPKASGSQVSATVTSLKFLKLIDANSKPTALMKQLVEAADEDRGGIIKTMIEQSYGFLFGPDFDLEKATGQQVAEKFRLLGVSGSTLAKGIAFFLQAAKAAGIKVSPHIKPPPVAKTGPKRGPRKKSDTDEYDEVLDEEEEEVPDDVMRFQIPIPGKPSAVFTIPKDLEDDDWEMLKTMLDAYIARMRKQQQIA
ncbi:MAG TPA: DUF5343 domain-containing protein [Burkholderiales bacterium]|nr:DUF5343 domain-containing protein [Burkholderiales bacterium]